jgi:predicted nuclease with TOPRIM domain
MTLFTAFAAFGLREKPDVSEGAEESPELDNDEIVEKDDEDSDSDVDDYGEPIPKLSDRTARLRERAKRRRERMIKLAKRRGDSPW